MTATTLWMWCGNPTAASLQPVFALTAAATTARAAFSADGTFTDTIYSAACTPDANNIARPGDATGLAANVRYYYRAEIDGVLDTANTGRARTLPASTDSVRFTIASCWAGPGQSGASATPNHPVGAAIAAQAANGALLHVLAGDHLGGYPNIATNNPALYRTAYNLMHAIPNYAAMVRGATCVHMWDDHDYGADNSDGTSVSKPAAQSTFRQLVPTPTLPVTDAVYYSFTVGQLRFVLTDLRSFRAVDTATDDATKTMLGATQKAWLKAEWLAAKTAGQFIVWVNTQEWPIDGDYCTQGQNIDSDHWGAFSVERKELDDYRAANGITDMVILCGDGHQVSHTAVNDYSTAQTVPVPVFAAAAMSRTAAYRPARWDWSSLPGDGEGHYADVQIDKAASGGWNVYCNFHSVDPTSGVDTIMKSVQCRSATARGTTRAVSTRTDARHNAFLSTATRSLPLRLA